MRGGIAGRAADEIRKRPAMAPMPAAAAMKASGQRRAKTSTSFAIWPSERVRSVSINAVMGFSWAEFTDWYSPKTHTIYTKLSDMKKLYPSKAWVFVDQHPDSINDSYVVVHMTPSPWFDAPASYHNNACGFSFADGHSEIKKWTESTMIKPVTYTVADFSTANADSRDFAWFWERTTEPSQ